jgi:predicted amidohydrolase
LLQGRAIENQAFTFGVNRVGTDGKNIPYCGHTRVLDYAGETLYTVSDKDDIHTTILDKKALRDFRNRFNFLDDQDYFEIVR